MFNEVPLNEIHNQIEIEKQRLLNFKFAEAEIRVILDLIRNLESHQQLSMLKEFFQLYNEYFNLVCKLNYNLHAEVPKFSTQRAGVEFVNLTIKEKISELNDYIKFIEKKYQTELLEATGMEEIAIKARRAGVSGNDAISNMLKIDPQFINQGRDNVVVGLISDPTKIAAVCRRPISANLAKRIFHLQTIFHTIFPNNFPSIFESHGLNGGDEPSEVICGTIRQRIYPATDEQSPVKFPIETVFNIFINEFGYKLYLDSFPGNTIIDVDGREYFVDTLGEEHLVDFESNEVIERIVNYMYTNNYIPADVAKVKQAFQKLRNI